MNKEILIGIAILILVVVGIAYMSTKDFTNKNIPAVESNASTPQEQNLSENEPLENTTAPLPTEPQTQMINMLDFEFSPDEITIEKGDTVTWVNKGRGTHYVMTSSGLKILDSKTIKKGESWSYTFEEVGRHKYFSPIYPRMTGIVIVKE